ncbi:SigE family RNA polymerase sigma factor [Nocardioides taihuensis]|uniref:SigE family RNA polymerase sigma factor n=1 Tax=Nocardioides taihuensis TaxID=1835606 RepID=A0ABW0BFA0_9ACTN
MTTTEHTTYDAAVDVAAWVTAHRPALLRAARAIAGDPDRAEDLLHGALVRVLPRWSSIRDHGAAEAYVRRTMENLQRSWYRRASHRHERATAVVPEPEPDPWSDPAPLVAEVPLWPLVAGLPARQRAAVVLRFYEGLSVAETAAALGCSTGTVKSNTSRGLDTLRLRLAAAGLARDLDLVA